MGFGTAGAPCPDEEGFGLIAIVAPVTVTATASARLTPESAADARRGRFSDTARHDGTLAAVREDLTRILQEDRRRSAQEQQLTRKAPRPP
jgi:hypothetical protein